MIQQEEKVTRRPRKKAVTVKSTHYSADKSRRINHPTPSDCRAAGTSWVTAPNIKGLVAVDRGMVQLLCSKPANFRWNIRRLDAAGHGLSRRQCVASLHRLEDKGILNRVAARDEATGRFVGYEWLIDLTPALGSGKASEGSKTKDPEGNHRVTSIRSTGCRSSIKGNRYKPFPTLSASGEGFQDSSPLPEGPTNQDPGSDQASPVPTPNPHPGQEVAPVNPLCALTALATSPGMTAEKLIKVARRFDPDTDPLSTLCLAPGIPDEILQEVTRAHMTTTADTAPCPERTTSQPPVLATATEGTPEEAHILPTHQPKNSVPEIPMIHITIDRRYPDEPANVVVCRRDEALPPKGASRDEQLEWASTSRVGFHVASLLPGSVWDKKAASQLIRNLRDRRMCLSQIQTLVEVIRMSGGLRLVAPEVPLTLCGVLRNWQRLLSKCQKLHESENTYITLRTLNQRRAWNELVRINTGDCILVHLKDLGDMHQHDVMKAWLESCEQSSTGIIEDILKRYSPERLAEGLDDRFFGFKDGKPCHDWQTFYLVMLNLPKHASSSIVESSPHNVEMEKQFRYRMLDQILKSRRLSGLFMEAMTKSSHVTWIRTREWWPGMDMDMDLVRRVELARSDYYVDLAMHLHSELHNEEVYEEFQELLRYNYLIEGINDADV